jgi:hypothetical protein
MIINATQVIQHDHQSAIIKIKSPPARRATGSLVFRQGRDRILARPPRCPGRPVDHRSPPTYGIGKGTVLGTLPATNYPRTSPEVTLTGSDRNAMAAVVPRRTAVRRYHAPDSQWRGVATHVSTEPDTVAG